RLHAHLLGPAPARLRRAGRGDQGEGRRRGRVPRGQRRVRDGRLGQGPGRRGQGPHARRRQRRADEEARPRAGREPPRDGHPRTAVLHDRGRWRGQGAERRGAGRAEGLDRGSHRLPALKRAAAGLAALSAGLVVQWLAGRAPDLVERLFARGLYPVLGGAIGCASALVPFSVAEVALGAAVAAAILWTGRRLREGFRRSAVRSAVFALLADALLAAGALYVLFLVLWGLNYRRLPFAAIAGLDASPGTLAELADLRAGL